MELKYKLIKSFKVNLDLQLIELCSLYFGNKILYNRN